MLYEMAGLVQKRSFVHQRKLSAIKKHRFSKAAVSFKEDLVPLF
jgi:hypothetical protein